MPRTVSSGSRVRPPARPPLWCRCRLDDGSPAQLSRRHRSRKVPSMLTGPHVILALKVAVAGVTLLLLLSFVALARGNYRLHGRINLVFFTLTLVTLLGFEGIIQVLRPDIFQY